MEKQKKSFINYIIQNFNMLWFIMAVGLGGTSVAGFAVLNYTIHRTPEMKGLLSMSAMETLIPHMSSFYQGFFELMKIHIGLFGILHLAVLIFVMIFFRIWKKKHQEKYQQIADAPEKNSVLIAPALAIGMTYNVFFSNAYFYFDWISSNLQNLMGIALGVWSLILIYNIWVSANIMQKQFNKDFDLSKMHFGWLLIPMSMAMTAAGGSGIAAMSQDFVISRLAFFLALIPFSMALFLAIVKIFSLFKSHYQSGMPAKAEFLPSFFIVMPIVTLLTISIFRFGHFLDNQFTSHLPAGFFSFVTTFGWAFMAWYLIIGLVLLKNYFKNHYFDLKYFDESQWAFVCPVVGFAVLGAFVYKTTLPMTGTFIAILGFLVIDVFIIGLTFYRQFRKLRMGFKESA